jgi:hypothetical protein
MIIKLTLVGLIIVLIAVIALSYYKNKEFFEDITPKISECSGLCPKMMASENGLYTLMTTINGRLELKDVANDKLLWYQPRTPTDTSSASSPAVPASRKIVYQAGLNALTGEFGLYNTNDQSSIWKTAVSNNMRDAPFKLVLQDDGNLVVKDSKNKVVWSTETGKPPSTMKTNECKVGKCPSLFETQTGRFKVMLQHDGVLMLQSTIAPTKIIAKAMGKGLDGPYTLFLGQNGNLMILDKTNDQTKPVWSSNSFRADDRQAGTYRAILAEDGSFTIRDGSGKVIWSADNAIPKPTPAPKPEPMPEPKRKPRRRSSDDPDSYDPSTGSMPDRTDITPDNQISDTGSMAMALKYKSDLLKDLQKVVRNELLANRMTKRLDRDDGDDGECEDDDSDAMAQGREYGCDRDQKYRCPKNPDGSCPPVPDMSEYIKKDSIPCFGCSLDY